MSRVDLLPHLEALLTGLDVESRLAADPVRFARRYSSAADREVAGALAASLAFGRVAAFGPVLTRLFDAFDQHGGPAAALVEPRPEFTAGVRYRWLSPDDLSLWLRVLGAAGPLEPSFRGHTLEDGLGRGIDALRSVAERLAGRPFVELPRGFRTLLSHPRDGSACKRWCLFLRWMVRPDDGVDLGVWERPPGWLVIPLDTHVARVSRFLGLTRRTDDSLRTAREVTAGLAEVDPVDPIRFDFALAHLGISGDCRGFRDVAICQSCPLDPVCGAGDAPPTRRARKEPK